MDWFVYRLVAAEVASLKDLKESHCLDEMLDLHLVLNAQETANNLAKREAESDRRRRQRK